ncbi:hypothetical protein [Picosynechococcus sp. NKBG15041c]|uniref:hypothetical protein n=1 Tax=Picosynechococcus sp. NKBG15041c TaxID=1407650 RepID=UPI0003F971C2|nr:hypothetical protein [Picosynechococcus sp. NKBG15041c]
MIITPHNDLVKVQGRYIQKFFEIFSSRWNFIVAKTAQSIGNKASWKTVTKNTYRYIREGDRILSTLKPKLEDELLQKIWDSPKHLVGLGFDQTTRYAILDIDAGSIYHPNNGKELESIKEALEDIGLVSPLIIQSSHSRGLHVYYPLPEPVKTFPLAIAISSHLREKGFTIADGTLEILPNLKKKESIYKRCRLPLQEGSYILDDYYEIVGDRLSDFIHRFEWSAAKQDPEQLELAIQQYQKKFYSRDKTSNTTAQPIGKLQEMTLEYEALLENGFRSSTETNRILMFLSRVGRLIKRLGGQDLYQFILDTVKNLPGYQIYCRHKHEIEQRCLDVARCTERHYPLRFKQDPAKALPKPKENNQAKYDDATRRIKTALAQIQKNQEIYQYKTHLLYRIVELAKCSLVTIKKRWNEIKEAAALILKPNEDQKNRTTAKDQNETTRSPQKESKVVCHPSQSKGFSDLEQEKSAPQTVCHPGQSKGFSGFSEKLYTKGIPLVNLEESEDLQSDKKRKFKTS